MLHSIRNEAKILPKLIYPLINKYVAYYEDPERNKAYLVLEHAGDKNLQEFMSENSNKLTEEEIRIIMFKLF